MEKTLLSFIWRSLVLTSVTFGTGTPKLCTSERNTTHSYWPAAHSATQNRASPMQASPWQGESSSLMQVFGGPAREVWLRFYGDWLSVKRQAADLLRLSHYKAFTHSPWNNKKPPPRYQLQLLKMGKALQQSRITPLRTIQFKIIKEVWVVFNWFKRGVDEFVGWP